MRIITIIIVALCCLLTSLVFGQGIWQEQVSIPAMERERTFSFVIGDILFIGGGRLDNNTNTNEFWAFDSSSETWEQMADYPGVARRNAVGFSDGEYGYMGLGFDGSNNLGDLWRYDAAIDEWAQLADFPGGPRNWAVGLSGEDKCYIAFGGSSSPSFYTNDIWEYLPSSDDWTLLTELPTQARYRAVGFLLNNKIYAGLGGQSGMLAFTDFWEYDLSADVWTQKTDVPTDKAVGGYYFSLQNKCFFGEGSNHGSASNYGDQLFYYDLDLNEWIEDSSFIGPLRAQHFSATVNNRAYIGSGRNYNSTTYYNDLYKYSLSEEYTDFGFSVNEGCSPLEVNFTDMGTGATNWEWTFEGGDPATSNEQNPSVIYNNPGSFTVSLLVDLPEGVGYINQENIIIIENVPLAEFTFDISGFTVDFINTSTDALNFLWDFGDGNSSTDENPIHTYTASGSYTVTLLAENECGSIEVQKTFVIEVSDLEKINDTFQLTAMPNPFINKTYVKYKLPLGVTTGKVIVHNLYGQMLLQKPINSNTGTVTLDDITIDGIYLIQVETNRYLSSPIKITKTN